jgi:predicted nucleic acid-binding Zn ribbon protein
VSKAAEWLRQERRKVLGDWAAFCLACGAVRRWFEEFEADVPEDCPQCGGEVLRRCRACNAPFSSAFAVECEECSAPLRPAELFGTRIRKRV